MVGAFVKFGSVSVRKLPILVVFRRVTGWAHLAKDVRRWAQKGSAVWGAYSYSVVSKTNGFLSKQWVFSFLDGSDEPQLMELSVPQIDMEATTWILSRITFAQADPQAALIDAQEMQLGTLCLWIIIIHHY